MSDLELHYSFTAEALAESERTLRRWSYWPLTVLSWAFFLCAAGPVWGMGWIGARGLMDFGFGQNRHLGRSVVALGLLAVPCGLIGLIVRDVRRQRRAELAIPRDVKVTLTEGGISDTFTNGEPLFVSWNSFLGFHQGSRLIFLRRSDTPKLFLRISIEDMSPEQVRALRAFLSRKLPEIDGAALRSKRPASRRRP